MFYDDTGHEFGEIMQNKGHYVVQGQSRSLILVQMDFLLVTNTNLRILHRFRDTLPSLRQVQIRYIFLLLLRLIIPMAEFRTSYHRK